MYQPPQANFEPQQNVQQQYPAVGQGYSSSQPQPQMSDQMSQAPPGYVLQYIPPQGQNKSSGGDPCCGCMSLSAASTVIGCLGISAGLLVFIGSVVFYYVQSDTNPYEDMRSREREGSGWMLQRVLSVGSTAWHYVMIIMILIQILYVIMNILLVIGVSKENRQLCMIWIITNGITLVVKIVLGFLAFHFACFAFLIEIYCIVVVVYYVKELNQKRPQGQAQALIPPTQVPSMIQPFGGPPPPYSQTQSAALMQQNPAGPGQTYPSPGYPGQSY